MQPNKFKWSFSLQTDCSHKNAVVFARFVPTSEAVRVCVLVRTPWY